MNVIKFVKLIYSKIVYVIAIPLVVAVLVYFLTADIPAKYNAFSTIYSGVTSNSGLTVDDARIDKVAVQNEYSNLLTMLKSASFYQEVALHLFAQHLILEKPVKEVISVEAYEDFMRNLPDDVKKLAVKGDLTATVNNLKGYIKEDERNFIYRLIHYGHKYYSLQAIGGLKGEILSNSDLIKITYSNDDPGICFNTVRFATEIFIRNYSGLKLSQSNSTVAYFEAKLQEIQLKLDDAEQRLLDFNVDNDIVNYYEQTEQLTTQQEKIELRLQEVKMEYESSVAVLAKLEREIETRYDINIRNAEILQIRQQLVNLNNSIAAIELKENPADISKLSTLKTQRTAVEKALESKVDSICMFEHKSQGIESQRILSQWLDAVKNNENYNALLKSMRERQADFMRQFKRYAPLGATIKRIEREIGIYEREYLSILHHLSLARQREQNVNLRSNMKIMDEAKFPINKILAPRKLYMIAAALFSMIFFILGVLVIELLDTRIRLVSNLAKLTHLDVVAAYCFSKSKKFINTDLINEKATKLILEKLLVVRSQNSNTIVVQILSSWDNAGKKYVTDFVFKLLVARGFSVDVINANPQEKDQYPEGLPDIDAQQKEILKISESYALVLKDLQKTPDFLLIIEPPVSDGIDNPVLYGNANYSLLVYDANSSWSKSDDYLMTKIQNVLGTNVSAVLTKALPDNLEELYGEIPKQRSFIRKFLKKLIIRMV